MSEELRELFNEVVKDHEKKPRNFYRIETANRKSLGHNRTCGDMLVVYMQLEGEVVKDISFLGEGCSISKSSASMMTEALKGKTRQEAEAIFDKFHQMVIGKLDAETLPDQLGKLGKAFGNVHKFHARVPCASLPWHTMRAALEGEEMTSTEHVGPALPQPAASE
ncbi:MAG: nitrogen fixation protein NifU [Acidobacteriota bacterium]|jgi:nitrogen fixation NifU-like protein|nr:nitrogen fixation protein NifU [Acidobacteriota bacterium]